MIEEIASKIHSELWGPWAKTMINTEKLSQERIDRWNKECFKPYSELSEEMKELDRQMVYKLLPSLQFNSYLNDRKAIDRLKREYQEHNNLIIGFDFDETIYDFHKTGLDLQPVIDLLIKCSELGFVMCLNSINDRIGFKDSYTKQLGIKVDYINDSPVFKDMGKPYFNIFLDDRAGLSASYNILLTTLKELNLYEN